VDTQIRTHNLSSVRPAENDGPAAPYLNKTLNTRNHTYIRLTMGHTTDNTTRVQLTFNLSGRESCDRRNITSSRAPHNLDTPHHTRLHETHTAPNKQTSQPRTSLNSSIQHLISTALLPEIHTHTNITPYPSPYPPPYPAPRLTSPMAGDTARGGGMHNYP
jgi:hypothetical protein